MKDYSIGLQLYSVRSDLANDFEGTLKAVSEMGYDGVEFAGLYGKSAMQVKDLCQKYNLIPISAHVPFFEMLEAPQKTFETYKEIGCRFVAIPYAGVNERPLVANYDKTLENMNELGRLAKSMGLMLMYHNHDFEFVKMENGTYGYDDIFTKVSPDLLAPEMDVCWVKVAGEDPCEYLKKYASRIPVVHFKDFVMPGKKAENMYNLIGMEEVKAENAEAFSFRPVGYGIQNVSALVEALDGSVCEWIIIEQDEPSMKKSRLECAKMSIEYMKSLH